MNLFPSLRVLLFQKGTQLDLYDPYESSVHSAQKLEQGNALLMAPRLLSTRAILITGETSTRVHDMRSSYNYSPLATDQKSLLLHLSRNTNFTYSIPDGDHAHLHIDFTACGEIATIPLPAEESWYDASKLFDALNLPMQRKMMLSPAETSLALVHHDTFPRIALIQLIGRHATALSVPSFDPEQLHFSPFFIDDQTLLFSVLDSNHWGTVRYRLSTGTYEILSQNFTDHAYYSLSGDVILQQSFFDETINVPFGSVALLEQIRGIPVQEIASLTGQKENHSELFSLLFQKPEESSLHFKSNLTTQSFNAIVESELREPLRDFWRDYQLKLAQAVGVFHLLNLDPDGTLTQIETIPFEIHPPATFAQYVEDAEPLLRALDLPTSLIEEYHKRRRDAKDKGEEYLLVDDLSY
ncbi:MAG: hypothetical protein PHO20_05025 [Candidatus Peribacteraceae bacterium]|nr:hypothetical protein [Candidatus Peribacteraceae bacterium]